jgi:hypothetical protein
MHILMLQRLQKPFEKKVKQIWFLAADTAGRRSLQSFLCARCSFAGFA